jgi:hypothetical protein
VSTNLARPSFLSAPIRRVCALNEETTTTPSGSGGVPIQSKYDKHNLMIYIYIQAIEAEIIEIEGVA